MNDNLLGILIVVAVIGFVAFLIKRKQNKTTAHTGGVVSPIKDMPKKKKK